MAAKAHELLLEAIGARLATLAAQSAYASWGVGWAGRTSPPRGPKGRPGIQTHGSAAGRRSGFPVGRCATVGN